MPPKVHQGNHKDQSSKLTEFDADIKCDQVLQEAIIGKGDLLEFGR